MLSRVKITRLSIFAVWLLDENRATKRLLI